MFHPLAFLRWMSGEALRAEVAARVPSDPARIDWLDVIVARRPLSV